MTSPIIFNELEIRAIFAQAEVERTLGPPSVWCALWVRMGGTIGQPQLANDRPA